MSCRPARLIKAIRSSTEVYLPFLMMAATSLAVAIPMLRDPTMTLLVSALVRCS